MEFGVLALGVRGEDFILNYRLAYVPLITILLHINNRVLTRRRTTFRLTSQDLRIHQLLQITRRLCRVVLRATASYYLRQFVFEIYVASPPFFLSFLALAIHHDWVRILTDVQVWNRIRTLISLRHIRLHLRGLRPPTNKRITPLAVLLSPEALSHFERGDLCRLQLPIRTVFQIKTAMKRGFRLRHLLRKSLIKLSE